MKDVKRQQIKALFEDFKAALAKGLWLNGLEDDGEYKEWHDNGQLWIHSFYKDGKRNGEYKMWYVNGQLYEHSFYKDGDLDGEHKMWHDNGQLFIHSFYKDGNRYNGKAIKI